MPETKRDANGNLYRMIPSLHELVESEAFAGLRTRHSREAILSAARTVLAGLKAEIGQGLHTQASLADALGLMPATVANQMAQSARYRLRRVINATGVVLHTNLGRAPLSNSALAHIYETAAGYCNLEFDLESGERSKREVHVEELLLQVAAGQEASDASLAALVVNNCAAATFLALNTLADGGEVIVSRGELIEIGGGFRIPEILRKSGAMLREVGTTNRTRLADYHDAISPATRLILRVHPSNFRVEGFVEQADLRDLVALGKRSGVPVFHDQGTGLLQHLDVPGLEAEPSFAESIRIGCELIAASGDKLLGGPQCGLLIGKSELMGRLRKNPLYRTYRVDKLTYAALEATLADYSAWEETRVPTQRMLHYSADEIFARCEAISRQVSCDELSAEAVPVESLAGGGTAPTARLDSAAISLRHASMAPQALLLALRRLNPPVIGRIHEEAVLLDLRTVEPAFDAVLGLLLSQIAAGSPTAVKR